MSPFPLTQARRLSDMHTERARKEREVAAAEHAIELDEARRSDEAKRREMEAAFQTVCAGMGVSGVVRADA